MRQHNAEARACGKALYQTAPMRQPSEGHIPAVGEEERGEEEEKKVQREKQQGNLEAAYPSHLVTLDADERLVKELESQEIHFALCSFGSSSFVWITVKLPEDIVSI